MGKYIVELESGTHMFVLGPEGIVHIGEPDVVYETIDGMQIGDAVINAKPYTEPDLEQVGKEAYKDGYDAGFGRKIDASYQEGLADAWEAARKVIHMPEADLLNLFTECYSAVCTPLQVFLKYDASECIEKIRQYEQKQEMDGLRQNIQTIVDKCGYTLDEIAEVLKEMREDGNRIQETMSDDY